MASIAHGYVYLVFNPRTRLYRIGLSVRPLQRCYVHSWQARAKCVILHTIATNNTHRLERIAHRRFADRRIKGEWFRLSRSQVKVFQAVSQVVYHDNRPLPTGPGERAKYDSWTHDGRRGLPVCGVRL